MQTHVILSAWRLLHSGMLGLSTTHTCTVTTRETHVDRHSCTVSERIVHVPTYGEAHVQNHRAMCADIHTYAVTHNIICMHHQHILLITRLWLTTEQREFPTGRKRFSYAWVKRSKSNSDVQIHQYIGQKQSPIKTL